MKLVHFRETGDTTYPVGETFRYNVGYIKQAANSIDEVSEEGKPIALVCRGTSGTIIAGGVGYILSKKYCRIVSIIVSRKCEEHHDIDMAGASMAKQNDAVVVVIDDLISGGSTLDKILSALDNTDLRNSTYSVLCISNFWDEARMEEWKKKNSFVYSNLERFDTILCNRRVTESTNINL